MGHPYRGCSAVCAGNSPGIVGERPSAETPCPDAPCWPEPSYTREKHGLSQSSPSPARGIKKNREIYIQKEDKTSI